MDQVMARVVVERYFISHMMVAEIGGMALWRLGVRCAEMDSRRRR